MIEDMVKAETGTPRPTPTPTPTTPTKSTPANKEECFSRLLTVAKTLNKKHDTKVSLVRMGDKVGVPWPSLSTGLPSLDWVVLGCGGIPKGRLIELYGPESSGKSTLALHIAALEQRRGGVVVYIDAEYALEPSYAASLGCDMDEMWIAQPETGEQALDTAEELLESEAVSLIIVDSVAALVPRAEYEGDIGKQFMGQQARMMGQACRKLNSKCATTGIPIIFLNQIREKTGVVFGSPEVTPGGKALKFFASVRLDVRRSDIKKGDDLIGQTLRIKAFKNKMGNPKMDCEIDLIYGKGINVIGDTIKYASEIGVLQQAGSWYKLEGQNIGNGVDATVEALASDEALMARINHLSELKREEQRGKSLPLPEQVL
jgi:recombination protein RecA